MKLNRFSARRRFFSLSEDRLNAAVNALALFQNRKAGREEPLGGVKRGRWVPDAGEACSCCRSENLPRSRDPMAVRAHCMSLKHCEHVFMVKHADVEAVRWVADRFGVRITAKSALLDLLEHQEELRVEDQRQHAGIPVYLRDLTNLMMYGESFSRDGQPVDNDEVSYEKNWICIRTKPWPTYRLCHNPLPAVAL